MRLEEMMQSVPLQAPPVLKLLAHDLRWSLVQQLVQSDYRVTELVEQVRQPLNLVSYHLRQLRQAGLVHERRSSADERSFYYSLDLERVHTLYLEASSDLHPALGSEIAPAERSQWQFAGPPPRLLFLCTGNSARSQMAEVLARHLSQGQVAAFSAGSRPAPQIHPLAMRATARLGADLGHQWPKHLDVFTGQTFDRVITLCDRVREVCPDFPGSPRPIHWSFPDPSAAQGSEEERQRVFDQLAVQLTVRIRLLLTLLERERKTSFPA
jgi:ArsR family transcriptional regulator, arsenate/arsenite/antimonite-responsive transcriptional repressor / arsenate reductase (thioredoxin)